MRRVNATFWGQTMQGAKINGEKGAKWATLNSVKENVMIQN